MKTLIFTGLVLGASTYLLATQSDTVKSWVDNVQPQAQELVEKGGAKLDGLFEKTVDATGKELLVDYPSELNALKKQVAELTSQLSEKNPSEEIAGKDSISKTIDTVSTTTSNLVKTLSDEINTSTQKLVQKTENGQIATDLTNAHLTSSEQNIYMPVEERSNALMALVHRMELKAAGY